MIPATVFSSEVADVLRELINIVIGRFRGVLASEREAPAGSELRELQLRGVSHYVDLISDPADPATARLVVGCASRRIWEDPSSGYLGLLLPEDGRFGRLERPTCLATP